MTWNQIYMTWNQIYMAWNKIYNGNVAQSINAINQIININKTIELKQYTYETFSYICISGQSYQVFPSFVIIYRKLVATGFIDVHSL